ncbi:amylo-alpha-1,6-glucosidase [Nocardioides zeicaulis]|uniref:Amylo-alpha-1,6-glucosidase n=1 Tax=Nocardioides zeicaulis TaxID=1776857 RepID=A0ABV6E227_9ACTN
MTARAVDQPDAFDLQQVPFSVSGSWLDLSPVVGLHTSAEDVHLVSHVNGMHAVLALQPARDGQPVDAAWHATPSVLTWSAPGGGVVRAVFDGPHRVRLRGRGLAMRLTEAAGELTPFTGAYLYLDPVDGAHVLTSYETGRRYRVRMTEGTLAATGVEALGRAERSLLLGDDRAEWEAELVESTSSAPAFGGGSFDDVVAARRAEFEAYADGLAPRTGAAPAARLAAYVLWASTVAPDGLVTRESVLMSMHWMDKVWSWDHCFNALALAPARPDLALDQWLAPFDHQDEAGALPDSVTHSEVLHNFVKPPVHGWAFAALRASLAREPTRAELELVNDRLARWTSYWLDHRRVPGHVLPHYQHGNDSGWDNSTAFDVDRVAESPDLAAFLVVQLDVLDALGRELGRPDERWARESRAVLDALLTTLWTPDGFVAVGAVSGRAGGTSSLLTLMPLLLGERLPDDVRTLLVDRVRQHLTPHGLATEPVTSPDYQPDGYWRGPIWAPSTALVVDGLRRCGEHALADEVSRRFLALCERSGFAENFDAVEGTGLRDRAYTWTAAVYLLLARDLAS